MSMDPGLNNIGIAIFDIETQPLRITQITAQTLQEDKVVNRISADEDLFPEQFRKRLRMQAAVLSIFKETQPEIFVSESPFFNPKMPSSFQILTKVIEGIFEQTYRENNYVLQGLIEPLTAKKQFGIAGQKGKEVVKDAVGRELRIMDVLVEDLEKLSEHAIDAIIVGYTFIQQRIAGSKEELV